MTNELDAFVRQGLAAGAAPEDLQRVLVDHGWEAGEVRSALDRYGAVAYGQPVPRPRPYVPAADAFQTLLLFAGLLASAWSLGFVLFEIIDHFLPQGLVVESGPRRYQALRWAMAWLVVTWPLFLWCARRHVRVTRTDPDRKHSKLRKWLTYVALFAASSVLLGDAVALLYNLLAGEMTARFALKALVLGLLSGSIFLVTVLDLRQAERRSAAQPPPLLWSAVAATTCVVISWALAAWIAGSPLTVRSLQRDADRLSDLRQIESAINDHYEEFAALPPTLGDLATPHTALPLEDARGLPYAYTVLGERSYELCATFDEASPAGERRVLERWDHPAGRHCFSRQVGEPD